MFAHRRLDIVKEMDSVCILREEEFVIEAIDSLLPLAQKQIDAILNRTTN